MPVVKGDKVKVLRGSNKGKEGKVVEVYRKKWVIHIEGLTREKVNGSTAKIGLDASKVEITPKLLRRVADTCNVIRTGPCELSRDEIYEILCECL